MIIEIMAFPFFSLETSTNLQQMYALQFIISYSNFNNQK